jgi:hypothetical protein
MKYILSTVCLCFLFACGKDDNNDPPKPPAPTKTEMITSSSWKYESGGVDQDKNGTVDITFAATGLLQPCTLDNTAMFNSGGTGTTDEGLTKCNVNAPQTAPFAWTFANSENSLNIAGSVVGLGGQFTIQALSATKLTLSKDTTISFGGSPANIALIVSLQH